MLTPFALLMLLEGVLRLVGMGYPVDLLLRSRVGEQQVWLQNNRVTWRFFGRDLARQPAPVRLPLPKSKRALRVFVFGESAAYGDPLPEFGLPRLLQALLEPQYPDRRVEVVNAAMTAINSHAILPIAQSCRSAEGDVWVLYLGNNEVIGPFGAGTVFGSQRASSTLIRASLAAKATRTGQALDALVDAALRNRTTGPEWGGMRMFLQHEIRQEDPRMQGVYDHFEKNLGDLLQTAAREGIGVVAATVAVNLKDCAPFASRHRPGITAAEQEAWGRAYAQGTAAQAAGDLTTALEHFRLAGNLDPTHAELLFRQAQCHLALGQAGEAAPLFARARDHDLLRFRADSRIQELTRKAASGREQEGIVWVNAAETLARQSSNAICGREFFYEHVHLNFDGNYLLARAIAREITRLRPPGKPGEGIGPRDWLTAEDCARRLGWSDSSRYRAHAAIVKRLGEAPFNRQLGHAEQLQAVVDVLRRLSPAITPPGLRAAEALCMTALSSHEDDWALHQELAAVRQRLGDFAGAAQSWRRVVQIVPTYVDGWQMLGDCLARANQFAEALVAFHRVLDLDPGQPQARCSVADLLLRQGRTDEAVREYERVIRDKPHWQPAHLDLGKLLEAQGRTAEAEAHYRVALTNRLRTPAALKTLAQVCFERGWMAEAAAQFTEALRLDPLDAVTQANLGFTLSALGRRAEARTAYEQAICLDPNLAEARVRLGVELGRENRHAEALEQFAAAVNARPELVEARLNLGIALWKAGKPSEARDQFLEASRQSPGNAVALKYLEMLPPPSEGPATRSPEGSSWGAQED